MPYPLTHQEKTMTTDPQTAEETIKPTLGEDITELFSRVAKLNDIASALLAPAWGSEQGIIPPGHPLYVGELAAPVVVSSPPLDQTVLHDRAALSAKLWEIAEQHIIAEWICCEPLEPRHELCAKGYAALGMVKTLLVDGDPEEVWNPSAPLLDALLPPTDRAAVLAEAIRRVEAERDATDVNVAEYPRYDGKERAALEGALRVLRRLAAETQQPEPSSAPRTWCKCRSCWGWFIEEHPGEDLDELGKDLGWWSGLPVHRDAPAGARQQTDTETPRRQKLRRVQPCNCEHPDCPDCQRRAAEPERRAYYEAHRDDPDEWGPPDTETRCTCGVAGDAFVPAGHYADCPESDASAVPVQPAAAVVQHAPGTAILCPDCRAKGHSVCMTDEQQPAAADSDRIIAVVLATGTDLHCLRCAPPPHGDIWTPVSSGELEDGGVCSICGVDVLIPQQPAAADTGKECRRWCCRPVKEEGEGDTDA